MEEIHSITTDKPKIDNGVWIPFMRDGQLAEDSAGKKYRITKSAIDTGYESFRGGFININHSDKIKGKIIDVKREGEFAYAKTEGLDQEALDVINSPAYRGVSQQSFNLASTQNGDVIDVTNLKGQGLAIALYPKTPGCTIEKGCGVPIASTVSGYSKDDIKAMLAFMRSNPEMMDDDIQGMMKSMMGMMKSTVNNFSSNTQNDNSDIKSTGGTKANMTEPDNSAETLKSTISDLTAKNGALEAEIVTLKSTIAQKEEQIAKFPETLKSTLSAALEAHDQKIKADKEYADASKELFSVMNKEKAESYLAKKPDIVALKSVIEALQDSAPKAGAAAGAGAEINSTVEMKEYLDSQPQIGSIVRKTEVLK